MQLHQFFRHTFPRFFFWKEYGPHSVWKNREKVSFKIASEASYVYILSGQKFIINAKKSQFWRVYENLQFAVKQCFQTKLVENAKIGKFKIRHFEWFSNTVSDEEKWLENEKWFFGFFGHFCVVIFALDFSLITVVLNMPHILRL